MGASDNESNGWTDGGLYVFSLTDPSNPQQISYFDRPVFKDFHMQDSLGIIPTGGNGVYTYYRENQKVLRTFDRPATKGSAVIDAYRVDSGDGQSVQRKERFTGAQFGCP
jgi:hypothetical protein